jgi:polyphosphate kinase
MFIFANGGNPRFFTGSADWMVRNFDHRFETITPLYDLELQKEFMDIFNIQWSDNVKARLVNVPPINHYRKTRSKKKVRSQVAIYEYLKEKHT